MLPTLIVDRFELFLLIRSSSASQISYESLSSQLNWNWRQEASTLLGVDSRETKLPLYWNRLFSKICLEMKIDQQLRFMVSTKKPALGTDQSVMLQPHNGTWHVEGSEIFLYHNAASKGSVLLFNAAPPRQETVSLLGKKRLQHLWLHRWLPYGRIKVWLQHVWQRIKQEKARKWWKQPFFLTS